MRDDNIAQETPQTLTGSRTEDETLIFLNIYFEIIRKRISAIYIFHIN
jgi:hypothetical protein